ncbi:hypothetical protein EV356DRAFT_580953 [Viridothelium virens]|uniref:HECT-type E3 ubiquitin transferase n=1 Tax=Viridothelium virens TaxID=1048519 RepID=A0A6A6GTZ5_VIRVR|nr:hypothetical protein EV356DRAFT_580953 [Viridothelium virens]
MGRITKAATNKHEATLPPFIAYFVKASTEIPLYQLPSHLSNFPRRWPFLKGDLYHWIPLLDRFDRILELFVKEYGLDRGPQTHGLARRLLLKGDAEVGQASQALPSETTLSNSGFGDQGDRQLIEDVLAFTRLLFEQCGNRSLYASSSHLNHLLNTTSLSLLKATLRLCLRLAQRYYTTRSRGNASHAFLHMHYNIDLDKILKLAAPFVAPPSTPTSAATPTAKGKEKALSLANGTQPEAKVNPADLSRIIQENSPTVWHDWGHIVFTYYNEIQQSQPHEGLNGQDGRPPTSPATPTPTRRTSTLATSQSATSNQPTTTEETGDAAAALSVAQEGSRTNAAKTVDIPNTGASHNTLESMVASKITEVPEHSQYELLTRIRIAQAMIGTPVDRENVVAIRLLAVANLAYVFHEANFQQKIAQPDSDQPRQLQLVQQLAQLIHPSGGADKSFSMDLQTIVLNTLEAIGKQKLKAPDVTAALNVNVNHGVLFYVMRKAAAQIASDSSAPNDTAEDEWREALFSLLIALPSGGHTSRTVAEQMVSAGVLNILVDVLKLRTDKAERSHGKILNFLDNFVHNVRDAYQALISAHGFDAIADLVAYEVETSHDLACKGQGMPAAFKNQSTDWSIPFYQQLTLRWLFKVINRFMSNSGGTFDRMLRNLIDSSQLLGGLRTVISKPQMYGSNIWSNAVQIVSNFIHHEPTSYQVIAEAGLSRTFLEVVASKPIDETTEHSTGADASQTSGEVVSGTPLQGSASKSDSSRRTWAKIVESHSARGHELAAGILPNAEAITTVPNAFEAICLNENGQRLFQKSNALAIFFEIFESRDHVQVLVSDGTTANQLGGQFDEMVRHHPQLKAKIMDSVRDMIMHVGILVYQRAESNGVGAKLWYEGEDGLPMVAGGRTSLKGPEGPVNRQERLVNDAISAEPKSAGQDVEMKDTAASANGESEIPEDKAVSIDDVIDEENAPTVADYISAVSYFLTGFFGGNQRTVEAFFDTCGVENVLDFFTTPCLPFDYGSSESSEPPLDAVRALVEAKPHLVMPSLVRRAQLALDQLQPFINFDRSSDHGFFAPLTEQSFSGKQKDSPEYAILKRNGTSFVKALVSLRQLCKALRFAISSQPYNQRGSPQSVFNQVNLTDMYARLVDDLGKLERSCIWEEILLQEGLSPRWDKATRVKTFGLGSKEAEEAFGMGDPESPSESEPQNNDLSATLPSQQAENGAEHPTIPKSRSWKQSVAFKNVRTLRHEMSKMVTVITPLLRSLGIALLPPNRRNSHHVDLQLYQKQNAGLVAEKIAEAVLQILRYRLPAQANSVSSRYSYWIVAISQLSEILIEGSHDRNYPQPLTLVLQAFKDKGGFEELNNILAAFHNHAIEKPAGLMQNSSMWADWHLATGGIKIVLEFYAQVINHKMLMEATQTLAMSSRPTHDRDKPDYFLPAQFLVELRKEITPSVRSIWTSNTMEKANTLVATNVIDILKTILDGEGEHGAYKRSDKVPIRTKQSPKLWKVSRREAFDGLKEKGFEEDLVKEAFFRCYDNSRWAEEYCTQSAKDFRSGRFPIPEGEEAPAPSPPQENAAESSSAPRRDASTQVSNLSTAASAPTESSAMDTSSSGSSGHDENSQQPDDQGAAEALEEVVQQVLRNVTAPVANLGLGPDDPSSQMDTEDLAIDMDNSLPGLDGSSTSGPSDSGGRTSEQTTRVETTEAVNLPKCATIDDLDDERALIRESLLDRSLDLVDLHDDVSFSLAELISAAVPKSGDESSSMRSDIANTLMSSLLSLREEDLVPNGKKVAAYAHLFGLVIQDKPFYEAARAELAENFSMLLDFVKMPQLKPGESASWIGPVLLIIERVLAQDEQPYQISWTPPASEDSISNDNSGSAILGHDPVPSDEKEKLFNALIDMLPRLGKDDSLALSILRILVILTRNRPLAKKLGSKACMQKLFVMIKQLAGAVNERVQSAFMLVLRHAVEDEETIRQVMRSDIRNTFEGGRGQTRIDTTHYTRNLCHLIIREPRIFVEVTNELTTLSRWDQTQRPQMLVLKKQEPVVPSKTTEPVGTTEKLAKDNDAKESTAHKEKQDDDRPKTAEMKPPIVENPDGVIHYLLCELLSYKDVDDKEPAMPETSDGQGDIEMTSDETPVPRSTNSTPVPPDTMMRKPDKSGFKSEENPIYVYRCFILYCLNELLGCYNRAKVEFINFSRKADPQTLTPSKPRSGVLNYLLNALVPTGTLTQHETLAYKKKNSTSSWAISVIVALCAKTGERWPGRDHQDAQDESELVFVRKFVLEHALKAYRDAMSSNESLDTKYSRLLCLAEVFNRMLTGEVSKNYPAEAFTNSQKQLGRIMYEKNFISALTSSIADIDLNFPGARRAIKYVLRPLKLLTQRAYDLSMTTDISSSSAAQTTDEDEISTASSVTDPDDIREETPDLFRNSTLGLMGSGAHESEPSADEEDEEDEDEMYDGGFEEMDYEDERDDDEPVSDDEEGMGDVEGLPGDLGPMDIEIVEDEAGSAESMSEDDSSDTSGDDDEDDDEDIDEDDEGDDPDGDDHGEGIDVEMDPDGMHPVLEIGSVENDDEDWEEDEDGNVDYEPHDHGDEDESSGPGPPAARVLHVLGGEGNTQEMINQLMNGEVDMEMDQDYLDEEMPPDGEEDEEDEDEGDYDDGDEMVYEQDLEEDDFDDSAGMWDWRNQPPPALLHRHHHHHHTHHNHHRHGGPFALLRGVQDDRGIGIPNSFRSHQPRGPPRTDDGMNPLLRSRNTLDSDDPAGRSTRSLGFLPPPGAFGDDIRGPLGRRGGRHGIVMPPGMGFPDGMSIINQIFGTLTGSHNSRFPPAGEISFSLGPVDNGDRGRFGPVPRDMEFYLDRRHNGRDPFPRTDDPARAVAFQPSVTISRWQDEARLLFGNEYIEKAQRVINSILKLLVPPAIEEKKKRDEEAAKKKAEEEARLKKEQEQREAQEKKEREEREAREREEAEARRREEEAARQAEQQTEESITETETEMEGVEPTQPVEASGDQSAGPSEPRPRVTATFRNQEVDITDLGIDVGFLEALPEDLREEVLQTQVLEHRARAAESGQEPAGFDQEFLQALPPDIREDVLRQEAIARRRRERDEQRRRAAAASGGPPRAEEMDPASFLASLDPALRQAVLMEQDDNILSQLPEEIAAEARSYGGGRMEQLISMGAGRPPRFTGREALRADGDGEQSQKPQRRQVVQMLDKAGVATILRLMFIPLQGSVKSTMQGILRDVCENRTNRSEVVTLLLSILQDGSYDMNAVERSFSNLSLRAKQPASQKTPQPALKRTLTGQPLLPTNTDISPLMVVQQCLNTLGFLTQYNGHIPSFFLTAHESSVNIGGMRSNKKGKGKEIKGAKFPLNSLLGLLDRKLVTESSSVMEQLAGLLTIVTHPLTILSRKKEKVEEEKKDEKKDESGASREAEGAAERDLTVSSTGVPAETATETTMQDAATTEPSVPAENKENEVKEAEKPKKHHNLVPPEIPEPNFRLVVNILTARECSSKTFKDTLTLMNNLSHINEARDIFGQELVNSAQELAHAIWKDLEELIAQVDKAKSGTDVQGLALWKFSPTSSDQTKLLRVLTALDYLFDPKRVELQDPPKRAPDGLTLEQKSEILTTLYNNREFTGLWDKLSESLSAIQRRENMFNVAQILSPLIEAFMVVCKNTTLKDVPLTKIASKEIAISSPAPESQMESLFFKFTEEHRKILNDLVRHNPKLMSGTFSLLVKNSKVLEFDTKRNYFNRRLHQRSTEQTIRHQPLQLQVRREFVFLDSFKSLYYKKADEVKFGKLSIRFFGEEGVDAGGVTREWFQALARQMFNPDYALFQSVASDRTTFHPSRLSSINHEHLMYFKFIGRIIGKALYEGRVLDCHFSRAVYKRMLGKTVSVKDMETLDLDYYKSLVWMLENDITDIITETFSVQIDEFGEQKTIDLIENGRNIPVTEENKREYVQLVTEHKMIGAVSEQLEHFLTGFHDIVPAELIAIFNEQELELLISGLPDIDVDDWKNNTEYHTYTATAPQIQWFWRAVRSFDKEERAKLLQFVTGTSKVPLNGFKELEGMNGFSKFNIHRDFGKADRLPTSHTCFNQLDLPEYESYEDLRKQLYTAFTAGSEYFGFA